MNLARIAIGLAVVLVVALVIQQFSEPENLTDNLGRFAQFAMVGTLVGAGVLYHYHGNGIEALRNLLIWLAIIAVVALAYQYRASFGL
jgi:uncharacterized membrane protein